MNKLNLVALTILAAAPTWAAASKFLPPDQQEKAMVGVQLPPALRPEAASWPGSRTGDGKTLPPNVPDVPLPPGSPAGSSSASSNEVPVKYIGTVNGKNIYRGEASYHFSAKERKAPVLVEQASSSAQERETAPSQK